MLQLTTPDPSINKARVDAISLMRADITLQTYSYSIGEDGSEIQTPNPPTNTIATVQFIQNMFIEEREVGGQTAAVDRWIFFLPYNSIVSERDQIIWEGETYEVTSSNQGDSERIHLEVQAKHVGIG